MINQMLHFLGAFVIFLVLTNWIKYKMSAKITLAIATFWEIAQVDMWRSIYNYNLLEILTKYDWIDTGLDLFLAAAGIALALFLIKKAD